MLHVIPCADVIPHDTTAACACGPTTEAVPRHDGSIGWLYIHHSLDGRESPATAGGGEPR